MSVNNINDVLYIKEMGYNFSTIASGADPIPIVLDATTEYTKSYSATVTNNPVGDKTDRADHYRVKPASISFSGVISDYDTGIYKWSLSSSGSTSRSQQYVERLEQILANKTLIEVRIPNGLTTNNCLITALSITRSSDTGYGFEISVSVQQIQIISESILSQPASDVENTVEDTTKSGSSTGTPIDLDTTMGSVSSELGVDIKLVNDESRWEGYQDNYLNTSKLGATITDKDIIVDTNPTYDYNYSDY